MDLGTRFLQSKQLRWVKDNYVSGQSFNSSDSTKILQLFFFLFVALKNLIQHYHVAFV